ncbi:MAG: glycine--tRNA ligase [Methanocellales archaeon]|nr:glycine--tRNA ligase [Methanocellales archaeon]
MKYERVIELAKRRGFLWSSSEIYGATAGFWDFGPLGAILKRRVENLWRELYIIGEGFFEIESPTVSVEDAFAASGHLDCFVDLIVECKKCGEMFKADHLVQDVGSESTRAGVAKLIKTHDIRCPECGGELGDVRTFNLMFRTTIGPSSERIGYLRPETAQGIFVDFPRLLRFYRDRLPFGVVQIGKAYRNEISPRQGVIRLREFTLAEAEIFVDPRDKSHPRFDEIADVVLRLYPKKEQLRGKNEIEINVKDAVKKGIIPSQFMGYHLALVQLFLTGVGIRPETLRFRQHKKEERAHYAADCWDAETLLDLGWVELVGIADRTDYDLKAHAKKSGVDMGVFVLYDKPKVIERLRIKPKMDVLGPKFKEEAAKVADVLMRLRPRQLNELGKETIKVGGKTIRVDPKWVECERISEEVHGERVVPHVIEPSYGIDRIVYALLEHSLAEEMVEGEKRLVLRLPPKVAPIQVGVFPLLARDGLVEVAKRVASLLSKDGILMEYDDSGTIGRRYRRHDEIGAPFAITVDHQTLEDNTVTIRERDSMKQIRVSIDGVSDIIRGLLSGKIQFEMLGR